MCVHCGLTRAGHSPGSALCGPHTNAPKNCVNWMLDTRAHKPCRLDEYNFQFDAVTDITNIWFSVDFVDWRERANSNAFEWNLDHVRFVVTFSDISNSWVLFANLEWSIDVGRTFMQLVCAPFIQKLWTWLNVVLPISDLHRQLITNACGIFVQG